MQHLGEGTLEIPDGWHNQSINVFSANAPGLVGMTITVNRDALALGVDFGEYVRAQSLKLAEQLKGFKPLGRRDVLLDGQEAVELEFEWDAPDVGRVHQLLVTVNAGRKVLNLAGTLPGRMNEAQAGLLRGVLHSLRFQPPGLAAHASPPPSP